MKILSINPAGKEVLLIRICDFVDVDDAFAALRAFARVSHSDFSFALRSDDGKELAFIHGD